MPPLLLVVLSAMLHLVAAGAPAFPSPAEWWSAVCRGTKLYAAMQLPESIASTYLQPIRSPWDGGLYQELAEWGYTESARGQLCEFDNYWHMEHIFKHYQMNPKPWYLGGDNTCFDVRHGDSQKERPNGEPMPIAEQTYVVGGKQYRVQCLDMHIPLTLFTDLSLDSIGYGCLRDGWHQSYRRACLLHCVQKCRVRSQTAMEN